MVVSQTSSGTSVHLTSNTGAHNWIGTLLHLCKSMLAQDLKIQQVRRQSLNTYIIE